MNLTALQPNTLPSLEDLPDDPCVLKGVLAQLLQVVTQAQGRIVALEKQLEYLLKRVYGRTSEKWDPNQIVMDDLLIGALEQGRVSKEKPSVSVPVDAHVRHVTPHGRSVFPESLPQEEIVLAVSAEQRRCPVTGKERPVIGYEISKKLDYRPSQFVVKVYKREKLGSVAGAEETGVVTAPSASTPVAKSILDNGLLAHIVTSKFADHLPLYRLEKMFERSQVRVSPLLVVSVR